MSPSKPFSEAIIAQPERSGVPAVLWISIIALGIITLLTLIFGLSRGWVVALASAGLDGAILIGLLLGHRWAYVTLIILSIVGVAAAFSQGAGHGLAVMIGNGIVVVPVLLCTDFFFPRRGEASCSSNPKST